jgi:hypothetical protein
MLGESGKENEVKVNIIYNGPLFDSDFALTAISDDIMGV